MADSGTGLSPAVLEAQRKLSLANPTVQFYDAKGNPTYYGGQRTLTDKSKTKTSTPAPSTPAPSKNTPIYLNEGLALNPSIIAKSKIAEPTKQIQAPTIQNIYQTENITPPSGSKPQYNTKYPDVELPLIDRILQEQRLAEQANKAQKQRVDLIRSLNFGQAALGYGEGGGGKLTPTGQAILDAGGVKNYIDNIIPPVPNPTFTFGSSFASPTDNKIVQKNAGATLKTAQGRAEIADILQTTAPKKSAPSVGNSFSIDLSESLGVSPQTRPTVTQTTNVLDPINLDFTLGGTIENQISRIATGQTRGQQRYGSTAKTSSTAQVFPDPLGLVQTANAEPSGESQPFIIPTFTGSVSERVPESALGKITTGFMLGSVGALESNLEAVELADLATGQDNFQVDRNRNLAGPTWVDATYGLLFGVPITAVGGLVTGQTPEQIQTGVGTIIDDNISEYERGFGLILEDPAFQIPTVIGAGTTEIALTVGTLGSTAALKGTVKGATTTLAKSPSIIGDAFKGLFSFNFLSKTADEVPTMINPAGRSVPQFVPPAGTTKQVSIKGAKVKADANTQGVPEPKEGIFGREPTPNDPNPIGPLTKAEFDAQTEALKFLKQSQGLPNKPIVGEQSAAEIANLGSESDQINKIMRLYSFKQNPLNPFNKKGEPNIGISKDEATEIFKLKDTDPDRFFDLTGISPKPPKPDGGASGANIFDNITGKQKSSMDDTASIGFDLLGDSKSNKGRSGSTQVLDDSGNDFIKFVDDTADTPPPKKGSGKTSKTETENPKKKGSKNPEEGGNNKSGLGTFGGLGGLAVGAGLFSEFIIKEAPKQLDITFEAYGELEDNKQKDDKKTGVLPILDLQTDQSQKQDEEQVTGQIFIYGAPNAEPLIPDVTVGQVPLLDYTEEGNPTFLFPPNRFRSDSGGGGSSGSTNESDQQFFRLFSVADEPFGKTTLPLGEFVDAPVPIQKETDVLSTGEIFAINRMTRNPLRAPRSIANETFENLFFGNEKPKKGRKKRNSIFDNDLFSL